jgi:hypothetical protein
MALLLQRLEQIVRAPPPPAGLVQVISGRQSYVRWKQLQLTFVQGGIFGFVIGSMLMLLVSLIRNGSAGRPSARPLADLLAIPGGLLALGIIVALVAVASWVVLSIPEYLDRRLQKQIGEYRRGEEGEERAIQVILQAIDGNWRVFRNVELSDRGGGDLDLILVGPPGVWALEVKNLRGEYRNIGTTWEYKAGKTWKRAAAQPSQQSYRNALALKNFFKADGLRIFVNAGVVWANPESPITVENQSVAVWPLERLPDELGNLPPGKQLTAAEREKITDKLTRLCDRQRNRGQAENAKAP